MAIGWGNFGALAPAAVPGVEAGLEGADGRVEEAGDRG